MAVANPMYSFPSNGALEVVFSFDTTGSMYGCLEQVRGRIQDLIQRLQSDIPGIRMAVFAHGDYCNADRTYVTKWIDFTSDVAKLCHFVQTVEKTGGGDFPECYELVLRQTQTELSWTPGSRRALVLIGDDEPHNKDYPGNTAKIDWQTEVNNLASAGVTIYAVQCGGAGRHGVDHFYKTMAANTSGKRLLLEDFGNLFDVLMAVCYREGNDTAMLASYEKEVRARCGHAGLAADINAVFASLRADAGDDVPLAPAPVVTVKAKTPVAISRKMSIKTPGTPKPLSIKKTTTFKASSRKRKVGSGVVKPQNVHKALLQLHEDNLPLLKRENVPEKNFILSTLVWSPWILVMSPEKPDGQQDLWVKRRGHTGYRLHKVKSAQTAAASPFSRPRKVLFELAVQTPGSGHLKHVVHSSFSTRCLNNVSWERCLHGVRAQLDKVLLSGCRVHLRYSFVGKRSADPSRMRCALKRYDYAWKKLRQQRIHGRDVTKGSYIISHNV